MPTSELTNPCEVFFDFTNDAQALPCRHWSRGELAQTQQASRQNKGRSSQSRGKAATNSANVPRPGGRKRRKMFSQRSEANRTTVGINGGKNYEFKHRISTQNGAENVKMMVQIPETSSSNPQEPQTGLGCTQAKRKSRTNARDKDTSKAYASMALTWSRNNGMSCLRNILTSVSYPTPPNTQHDI